MKSIIFGFIAFCIITVSTGCFTKQAREDQAAVNMICEEQSIVVECRIAQAYKTLTKINNGVANLVNEAKGTDKESEVHAIGQSYRTALPAAEIALKAAETLNAANNAQGAVAKLNEALKFINNWKEYKNYGVTDG